jgi:hypothetical protein
VGVGAFSICGVCVCMCVILLWPFWRGFSGDRGRGASFVLPRSLLTLPLFVACEFSPFLASEHGMVS